MKVFHILLIILFFSLPANAARFSFKFDNTPISKALVALVKKNPDIKITFIYDELENYTTSADINTDNLKTAVKEIVGLNPVTVTEKKGHILVEALQKGKYRFTGRVVNEYDEPVPHATILLMNPKDSVVVTYAITKVDGKFSIPCDVMPVIAKITSTGYKTLRTDFKKTSIGNLVLNTLAIKLDDVTVLPDEFKFLSDRTVYVPLQRQKNAALTGLELLDFMALPQIRTNPLTGNVETQSGQPVNVFIDYLPASKSDLSGMNMQDVKRVEFLEFPGDPRFQGARYVVNFIMVKYEYGGYFRAFGHNNFILDSRSFQVNSRFQYKKMTYDIVGSGDYFNNPHLGSKTVETFRLPQADGTIKTFDRYSDTKSSDNRDRTYNASFKATYNSQTITAQSVVTGGINDIPVDRMDGSITYIPEDFENSRYTASSETKSRYLNYTGSYFFSLPRNNSITFSPKYAYSHTFKESSYSERELEPILNGAFDNTNQVSGRLTYHHGFGKYGSLSAYGTGSYDYRRTRYSGTAHAFDRSKDLRFTSGVNYDLSAGNFYGDVSFGWIWDKNKINSHESNTISPFGDISLQYLINQKNKISGSFSYSIWAPNPNFKSDNIIKSNYLMSYTGNPDIVPCKNIQYELNYRWIPSNKGYLNLGGWIVNIRDRYVYNYEPTETGILRTIRQPMGNYVLGAFGISGRLSLFDRNLQLSGSVYQRLAHNGAPYNYTRYPVTYSLRATCYLHDFYIIATYSSKNNYSDGFMVGTWMEWKDSYLCEFGWANKHWNLRMTLENIGRWNWRSHKEYFTSKYYDSSSIVSSTHNHAKIYISATYTFSYGKKVKSDGEPKASGAASSGILKQ